MRHVDWIWPVWPPGGWSSHLHVWQQPCEASMWQSFFLQHVCLLRQSLKFWIVFLLQDTDNFLQLGFCTGGPGWWLDCHLALALSFSFLSLLMELSFALSSSLTFSLLSLSTRNLLLTRDDCVVAQTSSWMTLKTVPNRPNGSLAKSPRRSMLCKSFVTIPTEQAGQKTTVLASAVASAAAVGWAEQR